MLIRWPVETVAGELEILLNEGRIEIRFESEKAVNWYLELNTADGASLPFERIGPAAIDCQFEGMKYRVGVSKGICLKPDNGAVLRIRPQKNRIILEMK